MNIRNKIGDKVAHLTIDEELHIGTTKGITAASYQVALDPEFEIIVDRVDKLEGDCLKWYTSLPRVDDNTKHYSDVILYARAMLHYGDTDTEWFILPIYDQDKEMNI